MTYVHLHSENVLEHKLGLIGLVQFSCIHVRISEVEVESPQNISISSSVL